MTSLAQFPSTDFYKILKNERSIHPIVKSRKKMRKNATFEHAYVYSNIKADNTRFK